MKKLTVVFISLFLSHIATSADMREEAILDRVSSIASVCLKTEDCGIETSGPGYKVALNSNSAAEPVTSNKVKLSEGSVHEVKMLNAGADGTMVFEPPVLKVSVGDTINFVLVDPMHNSASFPNMIPSNAESWNGTINENISVTLNAEGVYVYNCTPHAMMAMVGVIQVGEAVNLDEIKSAASQIKSTFVMNQERLDDYLSRL
tara:strand:- start:3630 stop:4238 length:609 start_codon:yes stop_codon:yes gene_type:complete